MATLPDTTSFNAMQARISKILEIGEGDYGYGQVALSQPLAGVTPALILDFQNLRTDILAAKQHQVGALATLPITPITNDITSTQWTAFNNVLTQVEVNRLVTPPASQAARDFLVSDSITTEWNGTTSQTVVVSFTDADAMRHYFNTGSSIEFSASRTAGANTTKNTSWTSLLTNIGVVSFKRNVTSSTKAVGTSIGYSKLTETDQVIFQKVTTDTLRPNTYKIWANKPDEATLIFRVEFIDGSTSLADPNVSGTLTSTVNAYHASGVFVAVPAPTAATELVVGTPNPSFVLTRDSARIGEGQIGVTFTVTTLNFEDAPLYWNVKGYGISSTDFVENTLQDQFDIVNGVGSFSLTASDDHFTEGTEKFVVEIRTSPELSSPVIASNSSAPEIIDDLSVTVPVIITSPSYNFVSQSVSSTVEGQTITYTVVTTGVADGTVLYWTTKGLTAGITAADFEDNTLSGTITIFNNTADIVRTLIDDKSVESIESFQIVLSTLDSKTGVKKQVQISYLMQVIDTAVVVPDVPYLVTTSLTTVPEGSVLAVNYKITTPKLPLNTRLYWQTFSDIGTINGSDFNDGMLSGSVLISNQVGVVARYIKADGLTEGLESFHLTFYSDAAMTNELQEGPTVSITESVNYVITKDYNTMAEGGLGINYTVNTPALENGTVLYYTVVSELGTVDADDLVDGMTGTFSVNNNVGRFLIRAKDDSLTEGTEQFHVDVRATDGVSGAILVSSQSATISEPVVYDIISQRSAISEGEISVDFTIKTPKVPNGTVLYWSTVTDTGTITASDFTDNTLSGTVTITNNIGTITRTAAADALTEGDESFHLILKTGSASGTTVKVGDPVTISEYVKYTIAPSTQSISESGAGVQFNITTPKVPNGSLVYWTILPGSGNITADDFIVSDAQGGSAQRLSGRVSIQNNRGSFIVAARPDSLTEGSETFQVELRLDDIDGPVQQTTTPITISEIVPYQMIAGAATVTEGPGSVTFTVKTPLLADNTELYWTTRTASGTVDAADFKDGVTQGKVTIVGNEGTIIRTVKDDNITEGVDAFVLELRLTSYGSPVVVSSVPVTIQDTSMTPEVIEPEAPVYSVTASTSSIIKGGSVTFTVHTENVTEETNLYWTLFRSPGLDVTDFVTAVSPTAVHIQYNDPDAQNPAAAGTKEIVVTTQSATPGTGVRSFIFELRTGSVYGPVVATSASAVTISDEIKYGISASTRSIAEGAGVVTFTVTTPASAVGSSVNWEIVGDTGTITNEDFSNSDRTDVINSLTGTVSITGVGTPNTATYSGTGTFTLYGNLDEVTEGNETFHIALPSVTPVVTSPIISISEVVDYMLTVDTTSISEGGSGVTFTLNTPKLKSNTIFNYTIVGKTGSIAAQDFVTTAGGTTTLTSLTGTVAVSSATNSGQFTLYAGTSDGTEGSESFTINLTSPTGQSITLGGNGSPTVTITETVDYSITPTASESSLILATSFAEGSSAYFKVTTPKMDDGTLFWVIEPDPITSTINSDDFTDKAMSGTVSIVKNKGTIIIPHATGGGTEGTESYHVVLKRDSVEGTSLKTSAIVSITENVGYTVTSDVTVIAEGGSVIYTVTTPYTDNGLTIDWQIVQVSGTILAQDFVAFSGSTVVENSTAVITITALADAQIESNDSFKIALTKGGVAIPLSGGVIPTISITDSTNYGLSTVDNVTTISENGSEVKFTVTTPGISKETLLYWSIQGVTGTIEPADFVKSSGTVTITNHVGTFGVSAAKDFTANEGDSFSIVLRSGSQTGTIIDITNTPVITITDTEFYSIVVDKNSIDEGGASVTYTITTPSSDNGKPLWWRIIGPKGLTGLKNLTPTDFTSASLPSGTLNGELNKISSVVNKTATITLTAANDLATDGDKEFYIEVAKSYNGSAISFSTVCPKVIIKDTSQKPIAITKTIEMKVDSVPSNIKENGNGEVVFRITPYGNNNPLSPLTVSWKLTAADSVLSVMSNQLSTPPKRVNSGTVTTTVDPTNPSILIGKLTLYVGLLPTTISGACSVTFTVTDPVTKNAVTVGSSEFTIVKGNQYEEILSTQTWNKPAGVNIFYIEMAGGGGMGGGAGAAFDGGNGGNAGSVTGLVDLTNINTIHFKFIAGSPSILSKDSDKDKNDPYDWGGIGGNGGNGIAMYMGQKSASGTPWVTIAGAGGGGVGRVNGSANGGNGDSPFVTGKKFSSTFVADGGKVPSSGGNGGAGGGGGTTVAQPYEKYPNAVSRVGGGGGTSYVPAISGFAYDPIGGGLGGAGVKLIERAPNKGSYQTTSVVVNKQQRVLVKPFQDYCIGPDVTTLPALNDGMFVTWKDVKNRKTGSSIAQGDYILDVYTDGYGAAVINDKYYKAQYECTYTISLPNNWNNRITLSYQWFKNSKNYCNTIGISATLRPANTSATEGNYVWTSRDAGSLVKPQRGSGDAGKPAYVRIYWGPDLPTTQTVVKPVVAKTISYPAVAIASVPAVQEGTTEWIWVVGNGLNRLSSGWRLVPKSSVPVNGILLGSWNIDLGQGQR